METGAGRDYTGATRAELKVAMRTLLTILPALLLTAVLPGSGWAEMSAAEREEFRSEVREYLLENPDILNEMVALLEERQRDETAALDGSRVSAAADRLFEDGFSFVGGNPEGDVTVVEFLDYQCSFCRRAHPDVRALIEADPGIRWIVKELPILGPGSVEASRAAVATLIAEGPESYARLNAELMAADGPLTSERIDAALAEVGLDPTAVRAGMDDPEVGRRIEATRALATELGVEGTPSFVFGDRMLRGYAPIETMTALVAEARAAD
jgi:protein-disulfide isomerase